MSTDNIEITPEQKQRELDSYEESIKQENYKKMVELEELKGLGNRRQRRAYLQKKSPSKRKIKPKNRKKK